MEKFLEKVIRKYVIATLDNPTLYLNKTPGRNEYSFVENIELATKTNSKTLMKKILKYYYQDSGLNTELVVIPIDISYEIVKEEE